MDEQLPESPLVPDDDEDEVPPELQGEDVGDDAVPDDPPGATEELDADAEGEGEDEEEDE